MFQMLCVLIVEYLWKLGKFKEYIKIGGALMEQWPGYNILSYEARKKGQWYQIVLSSNSLMGWGRRWKDEND